MLQPLYDSITLADIAGFFYDSDIVSIPELTDDDAGVIRGTVVDNNQLQIQLEVENLFDNLGGG
jgi:hypothetical protein